MAAGGDIDRLAGELTAEAKSKHRPGSRPYKLSDSFTGMQGMLLHGSENRKQLECYPVYGQYPLFQDGQVKQSNLFNSSQVGDKPSATTKQALQITVTRTKQVVSNIKLSKLTH
jgi:hypothetical protein